MKRFARVLAPAGVTIVLVAALASGGVAATTPRPWSVVRGQALKSIDNAITQVSCPMNHTTDCGAAGYTNGAFTNPSIVTGGVIERRTRTWAAATPSKYKSLFFTNISCPTTSFCMAIGTNMSGVPFSVRYLAGTWSEFPMVNESTGITSISDVACASPTFCMAAGDVQQAQPARDVDLVEQWTGTAWSVSSLGLLDHWSTDLNGLSCTSTSFCVAVGASTATTLSPELPAAVAWNGTAWAVASPPVSPSPGTIGGLVSVSCPAVYACQSVGWEVGGKSLLEVFSKTGWKNEPLPVLPARTGFSSISCPSAVTGCVVVGVRQTHRHVGGALDILQKGDHSVAYRWNGKLSLFTMPGAGLDDTNELNSVSCSSTQLCEAAGIELTKANVDPRLDEYTTLFEQARFLKSNALLRRPPG